MELNDIVKTQEDFDKKHKSAFLWNEKINEDNIDILEFLLISTMGELGELSNVIKKIIRGDTNLEEQRMKIEEEVTDLFIYTIKMCNQMNINLEEAYMTKLKINQERFKKYEMG